LITRRSQVQILPPLPVPAFFNILLSKAESGLVGTIASVPATGIQSPDSYRTKGPVGPFVVSAKRKSPAGFPPRSPLPKSRQAVSDKATEIANLLGPTVQALGLDLLGA